MRRELDRQPSVDPDDRSVAEAGAGPTPAGEQEQSRDCALRAARAASPPVSPSSPQRASDSLARMPGSPSGATAREGLIPTPWLPDPIRATVRPLLHKSGQAVRSAWGGEFATQPTRKLTAHRTTVFEMPSARNPFVLGRVRHWAASTSGAVAAPFGPNGVPSCIGTPGTRTSVAASPVECSTIEVAGPSRLNCASAAIAEALSRNYTRHRAGRPRQPPPGHVLVRRGRAPHGAPGPRIPGRRRVCPQTDPVYRPLYIHQRRASQKVGPSSSLVFERSAGGIRPSDVVNSMR